MARMRHFVATHLADRRGRPLAVLDLGSQNVNGSYREVFDDPAWSYTGLDMAPGNGVDVVLDQPYLWSAIPTRSIDVVVSGQAFEHIEFPWVSILEVTRVLRPGGLACIIAPSSGEEHRYPVDCWRYYPDGFAALAAWGDLEPLEVITHWGEEAWSDDSAKWHDSVLVARRPVLAPHVEAFGRAKRSLLRAMTVRQANRRARDLAARRA